MTDESTFLRAIAAFPDDDGPRLVYADWLDERGDPRAEFIRLQCSLERGIDWITGQPPVDDRRLEELRARERELIEDMLRVPEPGKPPGISELTPEITAIVAAKPSRISFRRGMIYTLDLSRTPITALPPVFHVDRDLFLFHTAITTLPPDLHVGGDLSLFHTPISALPPDLHVGGNLHLNNTTITALPLGLHVGGNLHLFHTPITALPPDLQVAGNIDLSSTLIAALPPDIHVGGSLNLADTNLTSLPPGLNVGGNLNLSWTRITVLPPDLHVGGELNLSGTSIVAEAARRILDMPNLSAHAKMTGLESAGFPMLADEVIRQSVANSGPDISPRP